jgi:arylsulfatase
VAGFQLITFGSVLLALLSWVSAVQAGEGKPPNLILILADDVSADELSPYGGKISMPNLEKLAKEGVRFKNGWSSPLCGPSRAMIMTGKYPHHTGYYENAVPASYEKDSRHLLILKMLRQAGYATSMIGKKHDGDDADAGDRCQALACLAGFVNRPNLRILCADPLVD